MTPEEINREIGNLDLELLDLILKGYFHKNQKILETGCGEGRNVHYFIKNDYQIFGIDKNPTAIQLLKLQTKKLNPAYDFDRFWVEHIENLILPKAFFDVIICHNVLHDAKDVTHFWMMMDKLNELIKKEGLISLKMKSKNAESGTKEKNFFLLDKILVSDIAKGYKILKNQVMSDLSNHSSSEFLLLKKN